MEQYIQCLEEITLYIKLSMPFWWSGEAVLVNVLACAPWRQHNAVTMTMMITLKTPMPISEIRKPVSEVRHVGCNFSSHVSPVKPSGHSILEVVN